MEERAVVDRIVDGRTAVLLVGDAQLELNVPVESLPAGAQQGTWLRIDIEDDVLRSVELDPDTTEQARERIAAKMERLRRRGR